MDLRRFILRSEVLKLYREGLRTIRRADPSLRGDLMQQLKQDFALNRNKDDIVGIKYLLSEGRKKVKELEELLKRAG